MLVNEVLYFEPDTRLQIFVFTPLNNILQYSFYKLECYLFAWMLGWNL